MQKTTAKGMSAIKLKKVKAIGIPIESASTGYKLLNALAVSVLRTTEFISAAVTASKINFNQLFLILIIPIWISNYPIIICNSKFKVNSPHCGHKLPSVGAL
jgi:hypothetical protein